MEMIKNKRIGKVLLIVEGGKHEFNLIKRIFVDILDFTQIEKRRGNARYYIRNADKHSVIAVINTRTSNIESITDKEYLDMIFTTLIEQYDFDVNNTAIYYLFDRDPKSNTNAELIVNLIHILKNSYENADSAMGGMLILSYPSIEAYEISNFLEQSYDLHMKLGSEAKEYKNRNAKKISMNKIDENSIIHACFELKRCLEEMKIEMNLDDFSNMNEKVFITKNKTWKKVVRLECCRCYLVYCWIWEF